MSSAIGDVQHAFSLHRQGRLAEAESAYAALLARQPKHFDALHLLGMPNSKLTDPPARCSTSIVFVGTSKRRIIHWDFHQRGEPPRQISVEPLA